MKHKSHGVDLDGTVATYETGDYKPGVIGDPIEKMAMRIKLWREAGERVDIFTARAHPSHGPEATELEVNAVKAWCQTHLGFEPIVTCMKDPMWSDHWDDKAVRVIQNTGEAVAGQRVDDPLTRRTSPDSIGEFLT